jgi:hypothetical protein
MLLTSASSRSLLVLLLVLLPSLPRVAVQAVAHISAGDDVAASDGSPARQQRQQEPGEWRAAASANPLPPPPPPPVPHAGIPQRALTGQPRSERPAPPHPPRRRARRKLAFGAFVQQARDEIPDSEEAPGCAARAGVGYLERWRRLGGTFCALPGRGPATAAPPPEAGGSARALPPPPPEFGSVARCNAHPAADLTACFATNMVFDATAFMGPKKQPDELPAAAKGSVRLGCNQTQPLAAFLRGRLRNEGPRRWLVDAAELVPPADVAGLCAAGGGAVEHAVVFLMRLDGSNAFHNAGR